MSIPVLQVWSAPKCQADAVALSPLPATVSAQITEALGGQESGVIVLDPVTARASSLAEGRIVRAVVPLRGVMEWMVTQIADSDPAGTVTVTLGPLRQLLALRGFVREITSAATVMTFRPDPLTVANFITRYVLTNLDADGLAWLGLGTMEHTALIDPGEFGVVRRGELLALIERITGYEVALRRLEGDVGYVIDVVQRRGDALETILLETPATATEITRARDLTRAATAVLPVGDDNKPMGEVDWIGGAAIGSGPWWIPLTDPDGGAAPIREDGQFAGAFLLLPDGSVLFITATRASDSAVQVIALGTYATSQRVTLVENSTRRPVSLITSPTALSDARGLVVAKVTARGARQERTLNRNAGFEDGATHWSEVNGTGQGAPISRDELGLALSFAANGARAGGTSTATPLAVDGLVSGAWIRRGDTILHQTASRDVTGTVMSSSTGVLTLGVAAPGLPTALSDGNTFTLTRRFSTVAASAIAMPRLGGVVYLTAASVGTTDLHLMLGDRRMLEPTGSYTFSGPNGFALNFSVAAQDTSRIAASYAFTSNDPIVESVPYTRHVTAITATDAKQVQLTLGDDVNIGTPTVGQWIRIDTTNSANWAGAGLGQRDAPYLYFFTPGIRLLGKIATVSSGSLVVDLIGYPSAVDFRTVGTITPLAEAPHPDVLQLGFVTPVVYGLTNEWAASSNFTLFRPDTARTLNVDGGYSSGATSITTKPLAAVETRAWVGGDTLFHFDGTTTTTYTVNSGVSVTASTGLAAVPITIPSGVTLRRGDIVWSNAHGDVNTSAMRVATTVTGADSSVSVYHGDTLSNNEPDGGIVAAYRVLGGTGQSAIGFQGNTMVAAASAQANGSGQANVTLVSAPSADIGDNAVLTLTRPTLLGVRDRATGSVLRLFFAAGTGTPAIGVTAMQSEAITVPVSAGESVPVIAVARFRVTPESLGVGQAPVVALVNLTTGAVLAWGTISSTTVYTEPYGALELSARATLTTTASLAVRIYGGSSTVFTRWHVCTDAAFYVGADVLPYVAGSRSRVGFQRGQDILAQRKSSARYQVRGLDQTALAASGTPMQLGQRVRLRSDALDLDTTQRIVRLVWQWPKAELVEVECEALTPRFTDVTVSL
jgi:hypothetical protein